MTKLHLSRRRTVVNLSAGHHERPTDAAAKVAVERGRKTLARPAERFSECGGVCIVFDDHRRPIRSLREPLLQREVLPAFNLVRSGDPPGLTIDRPAETDTDALDRRRERFADFHQHFMDLLADARPATILQNASFPATLYLGKAVAAENLQLRSADLDADEHARILANQVDVSQWFGRRNESGMHIRPTC